MVVVNVAVLVVVVAEVISVSVGVVVVGADVDVLVVWVVTMAVVAVTVEAILVDVVVALDVICCISTLTRHCSAVCVVLSFFKISWWPVSQSMKPGCPTRASQWPDLRPQTTSRCGMTVSLRAYREFAVRTANPKGSMTCHSKTRSTSTVEPTRPITSLLGEPEASEPEPATQGSARDTTPTVATAATTPTTARHR